MPRNIHTQCRFAFCSRANAQTTHADLAQACTFMCEKPSWLQVSEVAGKESSIEVALDKMAAEWASAEISVLEYRDTGTFIIKLDEAVLQQLDDHIGRLTRAFCKLQRCFA